MRQNRAIELLEIECECVSRGSTCDRDCANCELVQNSDELIEMYTWVINKLRKEALDAYDGCKELEEGMYQDAKQLCDISSP